nr:kinesin-like protein kin-4c [Quercus suber]
MGFGYRVQVGSWYFTFDYVYGGSTGSPSSALYDDCVSPLVDALFHGRNVTALAYGKTGSGKTYTMGTNYSGERSNVGVIPKVMEDIFQRVEVMKDSKEFVIRVSFIKVLMDEVYDLLVPNLPKGAAPLKRARVSIQIRDTRDGGTTLAGVIEVVVRTKEEMAKYLSCGSHSHATKSTDMNSQSR